MSRNSANLDEAEVERFGSLASKWWDTSGEFRPLHQLGPARMSFIRSRLVDHFGTAVAQAGDQDGAALALEGLKILDIGCGGGLVCEPLWRMGATVTGIDPARENVAAARAHAKIDEMDIDYRALTVEALAETGVTFDAVVCLEVIEHVPDVPAFLAVCARLVRPGGVLIVSTLNRTMKSYALAIVAAEYVLDWVPRGTHDWERFVSPEELSVALTSVGLTAPHTSGLVYDAIGDAWRLGDDCSVNYIAASSKPQSVATS